MCPWRNNSNKKRETTGMRLIQTIRNLVSRFLSEMRREDSKGSPRFAHDLGHTLTATGLYALITAVGQPPLEASLIAGVAFGAAIEVYHGVKKGHFSLDNASDFLSYVPVASTQAFAAGWFAGVAGLAVNFLLYAVFVTLQAAEAE